MAEYNSYQSNYEQIADLDPTDVEVGHGGVEPARKSISPHTTVPSVHSLYVNKGAEESVTVKALWRGRYRSFEIPTNFQLSQLTAAVKEKFDIVEEVGASVRVAYLLWFIFGFFGVHRWYLKQHSALSWTVWFMTGQLFFFGWIYDGFVLWNNVAKFNTRRQYKQEHQDSGFLHFLFGFKEDSRPDMLAAYLLWFFFGWSGAHRWYTGYHTPSSYFAWQITYSLMGFGWLYDAYYTAHMVNYPRMMADHRPFYLKVHDNRYDYMPSLNDNDLSASINSSFLRHDRTLRVLVAERIREDVAWLLWVVFGIIGGHALYLDLEGSFCVRFFTGNYFGIGWVVEGIKMHELIETANAKVMGDFVPSLEGKRVWPGGLFSTIGITGSVENV